MRLLRQGPRVDCSPRRPVRRRSRTISRPSNHEPPPTSAAKAKAKPLKPAKPGSSQADGLGGVKFSTHAPPEGAGKATTAGDFPAAGSARAVDPKGGVSFTYKWKASNDPVDPYWHVRSAPGSDPPATRSWAVSSSAFEWRDVRGLRCNRGAPRHGARFRSIDFPFPVPIVAGKASRRQNDWRRGRFWEVARVPRPDRLHRSVWARRGRGRPQRRAAR